MNTNIDVGHIKAILATNSFRKFIEFHWSDGVNDPFVPGYHLDAICEHLQAVAENKIKNLAINVAIRHGKSLYTSLFFPAWIWARNPATRILSASYTKALSTRDALRTRQLIESPGFQRNWPIAFSDNQDKKDWYMNTAGGQRLAVSTGSATAGFDADLIICDDIHDFQTRGSETERTKAIDYFENSLCSRLVKHGNEGVVLAGHRIHENDVYSMLRDKYGDDGDWTWLVLPEEYTPKFSTWFNGIGWKDKRQEGDLLWPERYTRDVLKQEKKTRRHNYSAMFQQEPTPPDGHLFKGEWFRHYTQDDTHYHLGNKRVAKKDAWRFVTVDTAISTESGADFTVAQCWDVIGPYMILAAQLRKKLDGNRIVPALKAFYQLYKPQFVAVETEFVGKFVLDQLRLEDIPVKCFRAGGKAHGHGDKKTRAVSAEIRLEAGRMWFPANEEWVGALESELLAFPNGAHDDQVDCCSMAAIYSEKYAGKVEEELTPEEVQAQASKAERDRFNMILNAGLPF